MITSGQLKKLHERVTQRILSSQDGSRESREKSDPNSQLKVDDKAYPLIKEPSSLQTAGKVDNDKLGSSMIPEFSRSDNHKPRLPAHTEKYLGVHKSLSKPVYPKTQLLSTSHSKTEEEDEFEVEEILERRGQRYLIKWKGYPHSENTWEPIQNLGNCQIILRQFRRTAKSRRHDIAKSSRSTQWTTRQ